MLTEETLRTVTFGEEVLGTDFWDTRQPYTKNSTYLQCQTMKCVSFLA